jgi:hypothetical protein
VVGETGARETPHRSAAAGQGGRGRRGAGGATTGVGHSALRVMVAGAAESRKVGPVGAMLDSAAKKALSTPLALAAAAAVAAAAAECGARRLSALFLSSSTKANQLDTRCKFV